MSSFSYYLSSSLGAPVTDWLLYDTGYTERYMQLNVGADFFKSSVTSRAAKFPSELVANIRQLIPLLNNREGRLLLLHGARDENVHPLHTMQLVDALIRENRPYELQMFPKERHGLRQSYNHDYAGVRILRFLHRAFQLGPAAIVKDKNDTHEGKRARTEAS